MNETVDLNAIKAMQDKFREASGKSLEETIDAIDNASNADSLKSILKFNDYKTEAKLHVLENAAMVDKAADETFNNIGTYPSPK